jgi:hypothetical protein
MPAYVGAGAGAADCAVVGAGLLTQYADPSHSWLQSLLTVRVVSHEPLLGG